METVCRKGRKETGSIEIAKLACIPETTRQPLYRQMLKLFILIKLRTSNSIL